MTKKHYVELARVIRFYTDDPAAHEPTVRRMALQLAYMCKDDNPRFDHVTFFRACGIDPTKSGWNH